MLPMLCLSAGTPLEDEPLLRVAYWMKGMSHDEVAHPLAGRGQRSPQSHVNSISSKVKELQLFLESASLFCVSQLVIY